MNDITNILFKPYTLNYQNINKKKEKKRNPSIDFVRLIGMFFIILNHLLFIGNAFKKYPNYKNQ